MPRATYLRAGISITLFLAAVVASAATTEQVLVTFTGHRGGGLPEAGLVMDQAGNLYGTTVWGGHPGCNTDGGTGCGTVFELTPQAGGGWTKTVIYAFKDEDDGYAPVAALILDNSGNLYGTTSSGGRNSSCTYVLGCGTVFELQQTAGVWEKTTLYNFAGNGDAQTPNSPVVFDQAGNLYGTTGFGGIYPCPGELGCGTVYELKRTHEGGWAEYVLHSFGSEADGIAPTGALVLRGTSLFGTTEEGGGTGCYGYGCGTIFELSRSNGEITESILYSFLGTTDGAFPYAGLTADTYGALYGTATQGGSASCTLQGGLGGCGTVFALANPGNGWRLIVVHSFSGGTDGTYPEGGVTLNNGALYGTTSSGGGNGCNGNGCGTVYEIQQNWGHGGAESVLWSFDGSNGWGPWGNPIFDGQGNIYGVTGDGGSYGAGDVFELLPPHQ
jgi:hypothetical protein